MNTDHTRNPDRLIWLSLLAIMAMALIADQARANLHLAARAETAVKPVFDAYLTPEGWCRMHLDALTGDWAIGFAQGPDETSAVRSGLSWSALSTDGRRSRNGDAAR
jgi:hypothetical protein